MAQLKPEGSMSMTMNTAKRFRMHIGLLAVLMVAGTALLFGGAVTADDSTDLPERPAGLDVATEGGSLSASLDWDDVSGATHYLVRWRIPTPEHGLNEGIQVQSSDAVITVEDYGEWVVRVQACNDAGCGPRVSQKFAIVPGKPTGLTVSTLPGQPTVTVDWDDTPGATGYKLSWRHAGPDNRLKGGIPVRSPDVAITFKEYREWVVRVEACNDAGCGQPAAKKFRIVLAKPAGLAATTQLDSMDVSLNWDAVDGATSYKLRWRKSGDASFDDSNAATASTTTAAITVSDYGDWEAQVQACNDAGCGQFTSHSFQTSKTLPAPTGLAATTQLDSMDVSLSWDAVDSATSYKLRWRKSGDANFDDNNAATASTTTASITVSDYGDWEVEAQACNDAGCGQFASHSFQTSETLPAPTGLAATTQLDSLNVSLSWDAVDGATSYNLAWRQADGDFETGNAFTVTATSATITVGDYGQWLVRLEGCNDVGCGPSITQQVEMEPPPNRSPAVNEQAAHYASFIGRQSAPRGSPVSKPFEGIFSDPDGDELTYAVSVSGDRSRLLDMLGAYEATYQVGILVDADDDWKAVSPALPDPLTITVTLTATDPDGLTASVSGDFLTDWESHPTLVSAASDGDVIELTFDLAVEDDSAPVPTQFTVNVTNKDGSEGTIEVSRVSVRGRVVKLELASELSEGQRVTVDYAYDHQYDTPLQRAGGGDPVPGFSGQDVEMAFILVDIGGGCAEAACPDAPSGTASPGPNHGQIEVDWQPATAGGAATNWVVTARRTSDSVGTSESLVGSARTHIFSNLDVTETYDITVRGSGSGSEAGDFAQASGVRPMDTVPPTFSSASVDGKSLTVTFSEALDTTSVPTGYLFVVGEMLSDDGEARYFSGRGTADISAATVTVTLAYAVQPGKTVTVTYGRHFSPTSKPLQDAAGNAVASFMEQPTTNDTPPDGAFIPQNFPQNFEVITRRFSQELSATWDVQDGATSYRLSWRRPYVNFQPDSGVTVATTSADFTVPDHGNWVVHLKGCNVAGCGPSITQQVKVEPQREPASLQVAVIASPTHPLANEEVLISATVSNTPSGCNPEYLWEIDSNGDGSFSRLSASGARISYTVSNPASRAFRVTVFCGTGEWGWSDPIIVTWTNRPPVVNEEAGQYPGFVGKRTAPRGSPVSKLYQGIFSDPDGDKLTYTVSVPDEQKDLIETIGAYEETKRVGLEIDADDDWKAISPALPDPLTITVTLTATDPDGLSASVSGDFFTDWESHPALLSATASEQAIEMTFDMEVQENPSPGPGQFTVNVVNEDGSEGTVAVSSVSVNRAVVTLELASALAKGQRITLDYVHDDGAPLKRVADGGDPCARLRRTGC